MSGCPPQLREGWGKVPRDGGCTSDGECTFVNGLSGAKPLATEGNCAGVIPRWSCIIYLLISGPLSPYLCVFICSEPAGQSSRLSATPLTNRVTEGHTEQTSVRPTCRCLVCV